MTPVETGRRSREPRVRTPLPESSGPLLQRGCPRTVPRHRPPETAGGEPGGREGRRRWRREEGVPPDLDVSPEDEAEVVGVVAPEAADALTTLKDRQPDRPCKPTDMESE